MRKIIALILAALIITTMASCTANNVTNPTEADSAYDNESLVSLVNPLLITDENGAEIGKIDNRASFTAVEGGLIYSIIMMKENSYTGTAEYRFFSFKDKKDYYLGKLEDQGYEAGFTRTELDGVLYTLAVKGNPAGDAAVPLLLLAFDTSNKTMKSFTVSEYGFPYAAMTASGGKLLIMNHETSEDKSEKIYEFDPATEAIKEVLSFSSAVDSLRSVCAADNGFYLLRLKIVNEGQNEMYVDQYDEKYDKLSEQSVNDVLENAISEVHGMLNRQDILNEIGSIVSHFVVTDDGCMVYENFSISRVVVNLKTKETIIARDDNYAFSIGSGVPVIYKMDFTAETVSEQEIYAVENGKLDRLSFTPDEGHGLIQTVTTSADGIIVILTSDAFPVQNGNGIIHILPVK